MTPADAPSGFNSGGRADAVSCAVPVDRAALADWLARGFGLRLLGPGSEPAHPVWVDVASITAGRAELAGVDQHDWAALGWGALAGAGAAAWGPLAWAPAAGLGATLGRAWSEWSAGALGTYDEVLVGVPDVADPARGTRCTFVAGMITNSPVAAWGDRALGCGYRKQLAPIARVGAARWSVGDGGRILDARFEDVATSPGAAREAARLRLAAPLLGWLGGRRFARTMLARDLDAPGVTVTAARGTVRVGDGFPAGLGAGEAAVGPVGADGRWGALRVGNAMTRVTWAERV